MSPSRRRFLEGASLLLTGSHTSATVVGRRVPERTSQYDWLMDRYDPAGTGYHPEASGPKDGVAVAWTHDSTDWFRGTAPPIRRGDTLYAAGNGLLALDVETGERRYGHQGPYQSTPVPASGSIYTSETLAVTSANGVYGLNADGGATLPLLGDSFGARRWTGPHATRTTHLGRSEPVAPIATDGAIYTPLPLTNSIAKLDPNNGDVLWRQPRHEDDAMSPEFNRLVIMDGLVFVTNWPNQVTAYDTETGERRWQRELDEQMVLAPVATAEGVVVPDRERVSLLDATDGSTLWQQSIDGNVTESAPAVANGTIFVADERESLHALSLTTGESQWTAPCDGPTAPVVADGVVYAVASHFLLKAFDAETGESRFEYDPGQVPLSTPIIGEQALYVTNRDRILALEAAQ